MTATASQGAEGANNPRRHLHAVDCKRRLSYASTTKANPNIPPAEWPFSETRKAVGDVVISSIGGRVA